jgi:Putative homoserine kinase type II (protein kinase fold)
VRRTAGPWTPTIHALLRRIRERGVTGVPEPLGIDGLGCESLSFIPGEVANYPLPGWLWSEAILEDSARLLRRIHDATADFRLPDAIWQVVAHEPAEVICHNDFAPYNLVFRDGELVGAIDFDTASPGPRVWDLAYLAYRLVPFVGDAGEFAPPESNRLGRLNALIAAYGMRFDPQEVLATMGARLEELAQFTDARALETGNDEFREHAALYRRDATSIRGLTKRL